MKFSGEKLPLEYPLIEIIKVYGRRLYNLFIIIVANLLLLGIILFFSNLYVWAALNLTPIQQDTSQVIPQSMSWFNIFIGIFIMFVLFLIFRNPNVLIKLGFRSQRQIRIAKVIILITGTVILLASTLTSLILMQTPAPSPPLSAPLSINFILILQIFVIIGLIIAGYFYLLKRK